MNYQALMVVSFGGPNGPDDVMPFLENVTRGKPIPRERLLEVAKHYQHFGGRSPINEQNLALIAALQKAFEKKNIRLPIYFGNRNWQPFIVDGIREMQKNKVTKALAFFTSSMSSYSGCRQYRENIAEAQTQLPDGKSIVIDKLRVFFNHPLYIAAVIAQIKTMVGDPQDFHFVFTTHSIPMGMASRCDYEKQFLDCCRLVADDLAINPGQFSAVYQSRSGSPHVPWLGPDILDALKTCKEKGIRKVCCVPIGFISDHMEVMFDLDCEAKELAQSLDLEFFRPPTVGTHPLFIDMICELVQERLDPRVPKRALGNLGPRVDVCPPDCCLPR